MSGSGKRVFVDANMLLYARDTNHGGKQRRAEAWLTSLWATHAGRLSWQVLQEFYWNATRKLKFNTEVARAMVGELTEWQPVDTSLGLVQQGWAWSEAVGIAYWDAVIVVAAERCGAEYILSEDFQAGREFGFCRIISPFHTQPGEVLAS